MLHFGSRISSRRRGQFAFVLTLAASAICGLHAKPAHSTRSGATPAGQVTYNRDIAPIIYRSCSTCHRPGEAGPFSLLTYSDVKKHARQIAELTQSRAMPPWLPEPQSAKFADEMRLPDAQIDLIQKWVEQGEVEGDAAELLPAPKFVEGWQIGQPDMILKAEKPFTLPASGTANTRKV